MELRRGSRVTAVQIPPQLRLGCKEPLLLLLLLLVLVLLLPGYENQAAGCSSSLKR